MSGTQGRIGPHSLAAVRIAGGDETIRFEARLLRDGQPVAVVSNSGTGGCHAYRPLDLDGWAAFREFERYATAWGETHVPPVRFESNDRIVHELIDAWWGGQPVSK